LSTQTRTAPFYMDSEPSEYDIKSEYDISRLSGKLVNVWCYYEPAFPSDTLPRMWNMMVEDKTLKRVFYERDAMTFPDLVRYFDARIHPNRLLLLYTDKDGNDAGFGWFDDVLPGVRAFANICIKKSHWGPPADEASRLSLDYIFSAHKVQAIFGITPIPNRMALAQAKRLGFQVIARVTGLVSWKGEPCDATMTTLTKENFYGR